MKERKSLVAVAILPAVLAGISLCGCSTKATMSKQDQANFKGGPMPAGFAAEAAKRKAAAESHMPSSYKSWMEQRNAALAQHRGAPVNSPAQGSNPPP